MAPWLWLLAFPFALVVGVLVASAVREKGVTAAAGLIVAVVLVASLSQGCGYKPALKNSIETREFVLNRLERGTEDKPALAYTSVGVFSIADSFWLWTFDATDRYGELREGERYRCKVAGWRIRFLSEWENLIDCEVVPEKKDAA